ERVGLEVLHPGGAAHQAEEHHDDDHGQFSQRGIHSGLTTCVGASPFPSSSPREWIWVGLSSWGVCSGCVPGRAACGPAGSSSTPMISMAVCVDTAAPDSLAGRREESEIRTSRPMMIQLPSSEDPP